MIALISDIHANLEALTATLEDIKKYDVSKIYCLGDVIGYGPEPRECIKLIKKHCSFSLCGNHEEAVLFDAIDFHPGARKAVEWTRNILHSENFSSEENYAMWNFLGELRKKVRENSFLFVHGSPRQPTREYLLPRDTSDDMKMRSVFSEMNDANICFFGHTHIPGYFSQDKKFFFARMLEHKLHLEEIPGKKLINVGSVGQPRDRDNRACYVLFDGKTVIWRRVEYDYKKTMDKIIKIPELSDRYALRLEEGA